MVFSSITPVYLDPPNWHQEFDQQSGGADGGGSTGSVRPGTMAERARLAKIPQPETALKCPRCDSTNTKFCYFNNYSLSQPRHFCKTCRRYWTRGGALRNVPVGGGCRRNKRSKGSNRSKSPSKAGSGSSSGGFVSSNRTNDIIGHMPPPPPILPPLHHLSDYNSTDIGLSFSRIQPPTVVNSGGGGLEFQTGSCTGSDGVIGGVGYMLSSGVADQWRLQQVQQFPFSTNLELPNGLYQFEGEGVEPPNYVCQLRCKPFETGMTQNASVKMEENHHHQQQQQELNFSKNFLGIAANEHQYWSTNNNDNNNNAWTDLPVGFTSSSSRHDAL